MFAMIIRNTGGPEVLEYAEVPTPQPGQIRLRIDCAGVNPADWKNRQGMLAAFRPCSFPCIIGSDAAGVIDAIGEGVSGFSPGERVFTPTNHGQGGQGSHAEFARFATTPCVRSPRRTVRSRQDTRAARSC